MLWHPIFRVRRLPVNTGKALEKCPLMQSVIVVCTTLVAVLKPEHFAEYKSSTVDFDRTVDDEARLYMENQPSYSQPEIGVSQLVDRIAQEPELLVPDSKDSYYLQLADLALQVIEENHTTRRRYEVGQRTRVWNGVEKREDLPLCYEHHIQMDVSHIPRSAGKLTEVPRYVCPRPGCSVGYTSRRGYFAFIRRREDGQNAIPCVKCPSDGRLMYLFQVRPKERSFRLWRCPQCRGSYTNWELSPAPGEWEVVACDLS